MGLPNHAEITMTLSLVVARVRLGVCRPWYLGPVPTCALESPFSSLLSSLSFLFRPRLFRVERIDFGVLLESHSLHLL